MLKNSLNSTAFTTKEGAAHWEALLSSRLWLSLRGKGLAALCQTRSSSPRGSRGRSLWPHPPSHIHPSSAEQDKDI